MELTKLEAIVKEISTKLGGLLAVKVYIGVSDSQGQLLYNDTELDQFSNFIETFVKNHFKYLKVGDHSLPISGRNIMFFRLPKTMLVLYSIKGRVGQLLTFKSIFPKYINSFDQFVGEVAPEASPGEMVVEEVKPEVETIPTVPGKVREKVIFSRRDIYYKEIYPKMAKEFKKIAKFSLIASAILNYCNGENSILDLLDRLKLKEEDFISELYKLYKANWIKIPNYEFYQINCPNCKNKYYYFVPTPFLKTSPCDYIRLQIPASLCEHTFYIIIDKKGKIKAKSIPKIRGIRGEIDFSELSIEKLIKFFGQDIFFNLYHTMYYNTHVLFLESDNYAELIIEFMKNFFPQIAYGQEIQSLPREEYIKMSKWYADFLVIDFNSNIIVNEPQETEDFDYELRLFRKILMEEDEKVQIQKTHAEFERLILTWKGIHPSTMSIGSDIIPISNSSEILTNTGEWLIRQNKLKKSDCPISIGRVRLLLNITPKHRNGEYFKAPIQLSNGLFMDVDYNTPAIIKIARHLLEKYG